MKPSSFSRHGVLSVLLIFALLLASCVGGRSAALKVGETAASPPSQPASGPGSSAYPHRRVEKNLAGEGALAAWIFTPDEPKPASAPVILFLHGYRGMNPKDYGGWIDHLVRRGNVVIYPVFEESRSDSGEKIIASAIGGTKNAIGRLEQGPIRPELERFTLVGHSLGGGLTVQIAARAKAEGLPEPKAVMAVQPGWKGSDHFPAERLGDVPGSVLLLVVLGADDQFAATRQATAIGEAIPQVLPARKRQVTIPSDRHGTPPLIADHSSPLAFRSDYGIPPSAGQSRREAWAKAWTGMRENQANALNYLGYWRLFDALREAAYSGQSIDAVVGSEKDLSMGTWSDGVPVKPLVVTPIP